MQLTRLREHFGDETAWYYAFETHYTKCLACLAPVGLLFSMVEKICRYPLGAAAPPQGLASTSVPESWLKAQVDRTERTQSDSDLVRDDSAPDVSDTEAEPKVKKGRARKSILSVAADGVGLVKRPCSCCEWWLLYGSSATNWPDVIGQILWPLAYIVILILMLDSGWGHGAASACEQDIQVLCGVTLGDFMANDGRFGH